MSRMGTTSANTRSWTSRSQPWLQILSFILTVLIATVEGWSAEDLAWSFWLAGLLLGLFYLAVYQVAQGDRETLFAYPFVLLFFYFIFAAFLHITFAWTAWELKGEAMPALFSTIPAAIAHAARDRWPFLILSAITLVPNYVLDARTVNFTDVSKPLFARDMLRMIVLIFLLVPLNLVRLGVFALYAVLFVYFFPLKSLRQIMAHFFAGKQESHES